MADITVLFPDLLVTDEPDDSGWSYGPSIYIHYNDMVKFFADSVIIAVDDDNYQGDSYRLLQTSVDDSQLGQKYGILIFGWGSCSGCDALQACSSIQDYQELFDNLERSILWFASEDELIEYVRNKDWSTEWYSHRDAGLEFTNKLHDFCGLTPPEISEYD